MTKIYEHYRLKQEKFKQDFVSMNQKAGQKATSPLEREFYKLLTNADFATDCRNNVDNCKLEPIYDEIGETSYKKSLIQYLTIKTTTVFTAHK